MAGLNDRFAGLDRDQRRARYEQLAHAALGHSGPQPLVAPAYAALA